MTNQQYIIIGKADQGMIEAGYPSKCLLTRRVFTSHESAKSFIAEKMCNESREPEIVQCYLNIPESLYAQDWEPKK